MLRVLGVHGVGTYRYLRQAGSPGDAAVALATDWFRHLGTAMPPDSAVDLHVAYYGHHVYSGFEEDAAQLLPGEREMLASWVGQFGPGLDPPGAADWLGQSYGPGTRLFGLAFARELHTYLGAAERREASIAAVADAVAAHRPDVIVAHSLGSVVAYETLWAHEEHEVDLLVTLGSPLAMPSVLDRLRPGGDAGRPPGVKRWVNLADVADIVAVPAGGLGTRIAGVDRDIPITTGIWEFQTAGAYLRSPAVADVIFDQAKPLTADSSR
ncbi:serine peptidase [Amycolatopsis sp. K13G38]|uniref:Serine peptidase n=1 Tax=Amycolatopsis acididurans TaxID=2724524 RepID=A0ABX1J3H0_9PSEU|nr:serine peptidase [Amycolatopsis acididurans]NKQ52900.1 serine peptidase [Amycolatopsis acididurans]